MLNTPGSEAASQDRATTGKARRPRAVEPRGGVPPISPRAPAPPLPRFGRVPLPPHALAFRNEERPLRPANLERSARSAVFSFVPRNASPARLALPSVTGPDAVGASCTWGGTRVSLGYPIGPALVVVFSEQASEPNARIPDHSLPQTSGGGFLKRPKPVTGPRPLAAAVRGSASAASDPALPRASLPTRRLHLPGPAS